MIKIFYVFVCSLLASASWGQQVSRTMLKLPDTGQTGDYTPTFGEDSDYTYHPPYWVGWGNGVVLDSVTSLMWQQTDGGEMTFENALLYADTLTLGGYTDWRLPTAAEAFTILNHQRPNPALDVSIFSSTGAEYWWTADRQVNDLTRIWCVNAGGGIGNHPKSETLSAGGTKKFHARVVRHTRPAQILAERFWDLGNGMVKDLMTDLIWLRTPHSDSLTWENALIYAEQLNINGYSDWRLPNIKELRSLNDEKSVNPSVSATYFNALGVKKYWSSTTLPNQTSKAWYWSTQFGITTYDFKSVKLMTLAVRGISGQLTAIQEPVSKHVVKIFPNPVQNEIHIQTASAQNWWLQIIDVQGQVVVSAQYESSFVSIPLENLKKGIYWLRVVQGENSYVHKIYMYKNE